MFGQFQQSHLRIEVEASAQILGDSLLRTSQLRQWLFPQRFENGLPEKLVPELSFKSWIGPIAIAHHVEIANEQSLRFILSEGIDGYHEWYWGDGWVQSRLEGISLLPLSLGQTFTLLRLRQFVESQNQVAFG
ncbi:MAG: hypothetical protein SAJ12_07700 [Jaaginema sp. PMC 1079.18]|nr:hypothetical protein [Jaaginema sp. PMC 1080.18]MEC4850882.1 hypothetical protein [Jaaginema sp. PMC 1079.18]MEC4867577.1 hypothetical protein [Jaaginema sp. PMC 1078.18]